ncbi:MAG: hypothetical protein KIT83_08880 [Bryobacterales bacterium]|nr:hypothetical protein [Bryobacterales bacterium]
MSGFFTSFFVFRWMALLIALFMASLAIVPALAVPFDALVTAIVVDPKDPNRIYASTAGGLLKTDNRGGTWEQLPIFPLGSRQPSLQQIEFDLANTAVLYGWASGTTDNRLVGAWRSVDRGANWQRIIEPGTFPEGSDLVRVLVAPTNGSVLYAVVKIGALESTYRSANGGSTWTKAGNNGARSVSTGNADILYRSFRGEVYRSTDGAKNWNLIGQTYNVGNDLNGINAIAPSPTNPSILLASMTGPSSGSNGIFRSINGGLSWTRVRAGNFIGVKISVTNPNQVIVGDCCGLSLYYSSDSGQNYAEVSRQIEGYTSTLGLSTNRTSFDYAQPGQLIHGLTSSQERGVAVQTAPSGLWRRLQGTYTPTAVPNAFLDSGQLLSGDTSEGRLTVQIVTAEGGSAASLTVGEATATGPGTSVRILQDGSDPANPTPSVSISRSARDLGAGNYNTSVTLPVSGALNQEVTIDGSMEVVDQPQSSGVYLGRGLPPGVNDSIYSLASGNGKVYVGSFSRMLALDGKGGFEVIAGTGSSGYSGDGGPASSAQVAFIRAIALAPDGTIYFHDSSNRRIRRIAPNGTISTIAGSPTGTSTISEGAALDAINFISAPGLAVRQNGELLLAHSSRIWRIVGNSFRTIAGGGVNGATEGSLATEVSLSGVDKILLDEQGSIVLATSSKLFRIRPNNTLQHLAGANFGEHLPGSDKALDARLSIDAIALGVDGIYLTDNNTLTIQRVNQDGTIETVALNGMRGTASGCTGARYTPIASTITDGIAFFPDGSLLVGQSGLPRFWISPSNGQPGLAPVVPAEGVVNAASFSRALSPGSLASVFGTDVAGSEAAAASLPLPAELGGGVTCIAGQVAPKVFASPLQLNVQIPFGLEPGTHTLRTFNASGGTGSVPVNLQKASPEIFRSNGRAVVINPDGSLNNTGNGVASGEVVVAYLTGIGDVTPTVATGAANPSDPLAVPLEATSATVGGINATLEYLGMTPGFAGLAQANVRIPALPPGEHAIVLTVGSYSSEPLMITVK